MEQGHYNFPPFFSRFPPYSILARLYNQQQKTKKDWYFVRIKRSTFKRKFIENFSIFQHKKPDTFFPTAPTPSKNYKLYFSVYIFIFCIEIG